jgi:hypothetical protein
VGPDLLSRIGACGGLLFGKLAGVAKKRRQAWPQNEAGGSWRRKFSTLLYSDFKRAPLRRAEALRILAAEFCDVKIKPRPRDSGLETL